MNPSVAKVSTCNATNIAKAPYYSDCRWKTQNVKVHHNTFKMNRANFFNCPTSMCGRNAIFSNYGSYPSWSPYKGEKISKAIVHDQGNTFSDNSLRRNLELHGLGHRQPGLTRRLEGRALPPGRRKHLHRLIGPTMSSSGYGRLRTLVSARATPASAIIRSGFQTGSPKDRGSLVRSLARGLTVVLVSALVVVVVPAGATAATTQTSSCTDGGKHRWKGRAVWGAVYRDAAGVKRVSMSAVRFTSAAKDATTVDYSIKGYDGAGKRIYHVTQQDRAFKFRGGTVYLTRNPRNPPSAPGKAKIVLSVGDGNDGRGNCTMTFVQPAAVAPVPRGSWPSAPPAKICGNTALLRGPAKAPAGAIVVPAGNNSVGQPGASREDVLVCPGVHKLGSGEFDQIAPGDNSTYIGGPGAILDGQGKNAYAFTGHATAT